VGLGFGASVVSAEAASAGDGAQLASKYNRQACHAMDKKVVGPGYKEIAKKSAGDKRLSFG